MIVSSFTTTSWKNKRTAKLLWTLCEKLKFAFHHSVLSVWIVVAALGDRVRVATAAGQVEVVREGELQTGDQVTVQNGRAVKKRLDGDAPVFLYRKEKPAGTRHNHGEKSVSRLGIWCPNWLSKPAATKTSAFRELLSASKYWTQSLSGHNPHSRLGITIVKEHEHQRSGSGNFQAQGR